MVCVSAVGLPTPTGNPDTPSFFTNFGRPAINVAAPGGNATFDAAGKVVVQPGWPWAGLAALLAAEQGSGHPAHVRAAIQESPGPRSTRPALLVSV